MKLKDIIKTSEVYNNLKDNMFIVWTCDPNDEVVKIKTPSQRNVTSNLKEGNAIIVVIDGLPRLFITPSASRTYNVYNLMCKDTKRLNGVYNFTYSKIKDLIDLRVKESGSNDVPEFYVLKDNTDIQVKKQQRYLSCLITDPLQERLGIMPNLATEKRFEKRKDIALNKIKEAVLTQTNKLKIAMVEAADKFSEDVYDKAINGFTSEISFELLRNDKAMCEYMPKIRLLNMIKCDIKRLTLNGGIQKLKELEEKIK